MVRSLAFALTVSLGMVGCVVHTHETPESSLTSTTRATNATAPTPYDPKFQVSDRIYEQCQLASRTNMDVAQGTAECMKTGPMSGKRVEISGSPDEVTRARDRLVGGGVDPSRIEMLSGDGPAVIEIYETHRLGKRKKM